MSMNELNTTAHDLMSVRAMIEELEAEAQALTDKLKAVMVEQGDGSPPGGRLESHLEERGQQPVRLQAVQSRPLRPVQPPDHHHPLSSQHMSGLEQQRLDLLYALLKKEKDPDTAAALRWAIFTLEQYLK